MVSVPRNIKQLRAMKLIADVFCAVTLAFIVLIIISGWVGKADAGLRNERPGHLPAGVCCTRANQATLQASPVGLISFSQSLKKGKGRNNANDNKKITY